MPSHGLKAKSLNQGSRALGGANRNVFFECSPSLGAECSMEGNSSILA